MSRSVWKGPFVEESLIKKVENQKNESNKKPIKTWSRKSTIIPEFVGHSFLIYNGKKFIPIKISEEMVGHKLGEFSPTRQFSGHTPADKKAAQTEAVSVTCHAQKGRGGACSAAHPCAHSVYLPPRNGQLCPDIARLPPLSA